MDRSASEPRQTQAHGSSAGVTKRGMRVGVKFLVIPAYAGMTSRNVVPYPFLGNPLLCLIGAPVVVAVTWYLYKAAATVSYFERKSIRSSTG